MRHSKSQRTDTKSGPLVGRYFHSIEKNDDGRNVVQWQGQVIEKISDEVYLVELFEWITGSDSYGKLVPLSDMLQWQFYESNEQMNDWYEHSYRPPEPKTKRYPQVS